jgi:acetyl/propionyl-CoA carboxylase alpha subunit
VTELVYGIDIVQWQIRIAAGERLPGRLARPDEFSSPAGASERSGAELGTSIEARIVAEDPARGFLPQTGRIELLRLPQAPCVRFDHALREGLEVTPYYDSLLGKLVVWHETRAGAIARLRSALRELRILGVPTNIAFLQDVLAHPAYQAGELHTGFIDEQMADWQPPVTDDVVRALVTELKKTTVGAAARRRNSRYVLDGGVPPPPLEEVNVWQSLDGWSNT